MPWEKGACVCCLHKAILEKILCWFFFSFLFFEINLLAWGFFHFPPQYQLAAIIKKKMWECWPNYCSSYPFLIKVSVHRQSPVPVSFILRRGCTREYHAESQWVILCYWLLRIYIYIFKSSSITFIVTMLLFNHLILHTIATSLFFLYIFFFTFNFLTILNI